jgi:hypothetical protein
LIGVRVQSLVIQAAQIGFGVKKKVAENDGAEALDRGGKLFVGIVGGGKLLHFCEEDWINRFAEFSAGLQFGP